MSDRSSLSPLERFLCLFTDVRAGEGGTALAMFANVFLILCSYYLMKPLREGWIAVSPVAGLDAWLVKALMTFGQILILVPVIAWYSRMVDRLPRVRVVTLATLFCMSNMVVFWVIQPDYFIANLPWSGIAFYVWVGMFSVFVVAQFWAFAADVFSDAEGRRLMPMIAIGATAGAASGAKITEFLVKGGFAELLAGLGLEPLAALARQTLQTEALLLIACLPLGVSLLLTRHVDAGRSRAAESQPSAARDTSGGLNMVLSSRFLLAVAGVTVLLNWVNTNGENLLFRVVQEMLAGEAAAAGVTGEVELLEFTKNGTTAFYGNFFSWVNAVALVLQALVASRLLKYGGFAPLLLLLPVVALTSYASMAFLPLLAVVKGMKIAENATDYSINNTARHVLWLPVDSDVKLKGKPTIDALFARIGDGMAAVTALVGAQLLALATETYFAFNVFLILIWLAFSVRIVREHKRLSEARAESAGE
ncbi:MAG: hypothetical protein JRH16_03180 [Deltaproteobacteria bacterium]|nr:hypothetical protein [Deltaproteobacteria bacterium]MBW2360278.1 hypothetical protein [Deltaproteobacteria bacterium]